MWERQKPKRRHRAIKKAEENLIRHNLNKPQYRIGTNIQIRVVQPGTRIN